MEFTLAFGPKPEFSFSFKFGNWSSVKKNKIKLTTEQMFYIITLGSLPGVIIFLLNRASQYYPDIGGGS